MKELTKTSQSFPGTTEEYIMQVSEEIKSRFTKNFSDDFSTAESRNFGALSKLD